MAIVIVLTSGHTFDETNGDTLTPELLNKMFENGFATISNLPVGLSDGGTNATTAQGAAKNLEAVSRISAWLEFDAAGSPPQVPLGTIPADSYVLDRRLFVDTLFDSSGPDNIECGTAADNDAIFTTTSVDTIGDKTPTAGVVFYTSTALAIIAFAPDIGGAATGKALITVTFAQVPTIP